MNWYAFKANNCQTLYGFGSPTESGRYEDILNRDREIHHYMAVQVTEGQAGEDGFNLSDAIAGYEDTK